MLLPNDIVDKKVIISPLDWGKGHTTRCVPIIQQLIDQGNEVHFAGNEEQIAFIENEFPGIVTKYLRGYNVKLDSRRSTYWQILLQSAGVKKAISNERNWIEEECEKEAYDVIISDNRYGFRNSKVTSVMITHQLKLKVPAFRNFINITMRGYLNRFDAIWIPDDLDKPLCGELLMQNLNVPALPIGMLSRFKKLDLEKKYTVTFILSGPEPERSRFERLCIKAIETGSGKYAIVGSPYSAENCDSFPAPTTNELEQVINQSELIITRAGYTSIMELIALEKNAIMIPTSGQFEQEYLAEIIKVPFIKFYTEKEFFLEFIGRN